MAARPLDGPDDKISILIAGMPNVGKSSILNSLRRVGVSKGTLPRDWSTCSFQFRQSSLDVLCSGTHPTALNGYQDLALPADVHLRHARDHGAVPGQGSQGERDRAQAGLDGWDQGESL